MVVVMRIVAASVAGEIYPSYLCGTKKLTSLTKWSQQPPKASYWGYRIKVKSLLLE